LQIGGRARDHAQDRGRGSLLLQRLLCLVEQAHVLDRDHRLRGENLEQGHLPLGEEFNLGATEADRANRDAFSHQGEARLVR
jgi:hypothetical protein